jgi:hypothetical protein
MGGSLCHRIEQFHLLFGQIEKGSACRLSGLRLMLAQDKDDGVVLSNLIQTSKAFLPGSAALFYPPAHRRRPARFFSLLP